MSSSSEDSAADAAPHSGAHNGGVNGVALLRGACVERLPAASMNDGHGARLRRGAAFGQSLSKCDSSDCLLCSAWKAGVHLQQQQHHHHQCSLLRKRSVPGHGVQRSYAAASVSPYHTEHTAIIQGVQRGQFQHEGVPVGQGGALAHLRVDPFQDGDAVMQDRLQDQHQAAGAQRQQQEQEGFHHHFGAGDQVAHSNQHQHQAPPRRRRWWAARRPPPWRFQPEFHALSGPAPAVLHPYAQLVGLAGHYTTHDIISALEFSPNGQLLASGSLSKQVRLYDLGEMFHSASLLGGQCGCQCSGDALAPWHPHTQQHQQPHHHHHQTHRWHAGPGSNGTGDGGPGPLSWQQPASGGVSRRSSCGSDSGGVGECYSSSGPDTVLPCSQHHHEASVAAAGAAEDDVGGRQCYLQHAPLSPPSCPLHGPVVVHRLPSKVSCLSWSPAHDGVVCVGDYDGVLTQLHVGSGHQLADVDAHAGRRIWGVAHSALQAPGHLCASVSEDGTAKLWGGASLETCVSVLRPQQRSRSSGGGAGSGLQLGGVVPLCGVDFSPLQPHLLALAGADCSVRVYDLRGSHTEPLLALHGAHQRPVSYVKFFGHGQLASASTDATLALWDLAGGGAADTAWEPFFTPSSNGGQLQQQQQEHVPVQVFRGHRNEKNFVGLAVRPEDGLLACGSETDRAFVFHRSWTDPLASHHVTSSSYTSCAPWAPSATHQPTAHLPSCTQHLHAGPPVSQPFVSSVAWQPVGAARELALPPMLAAGTSAGGITLLTLHGATGGHGGAGDGGEDKDEQAGGFAA